MNIYGNHEHRGEDAFIKAQFEIARLKARASGLSLRQAAAVSGIPYPTLYAGSRRLGITIAKVYRPRTVKGKVRL